MFNVGDSVNISNSNLSGKIVELRGPLGPGGEQVYRVKFSRKMYIEVLESQLSHKNRATEYVELREEIAALRTRLGSRQIKLEELYQDMTPEERRDAEALMLRNRLLKTI